MWQKNLDTGRWTSKVDSLSKDNYDFYKEELSKVKLYSKCLSGSTYLKINDFANIYPEFQIQRSGFFIGTQSAPPRGQRIRLNDVTRREFYDKYLKEDAFTLKNLFTPERLLNDQGKNFKYVDVATTEAIGFTQSPNLTIDGVVLKSGQRVLVKDQKNVQSLALTVNVDNYFINTVTVSNYYPLDDESGNRSYFYYNSENGIYLYDGSQLIREDDFSNYDKVFKYAAYVRYGNINAGKEFHLQRTKFGYFPTEGYNIEFKESKNWVLRHRVDYNNIYDINLYDATNHATQSIYDISTGRTFSIPQRTISVGEFGIIFNNQDRILSTSTYSSTSIIPNKYKATLNSIANCTRAYWVCGDEGHLLKINKIDFKIEKIQLNEELPFMSIDFYTDQFGMVVGKFNNIYYTRDFGVKWYKLEFEEFEEYSYNRVVHLDENRVYVAGESGVFIEFTYTEGSWSAYSRAIIKEGAGTDEFLLSEDITDMKKTNWVKFDTFSYSQNLKSSFAGNIVYENTLHDGYRVMRISLSSPYFLSSSTFSNFAGARTFIGFSVTNQNGFSRQNSAYGTPIGTPFWTFAQTAWDTWRNTSYNPASKYSFTFSLPLDQYGNLVNSKYDVNVEIRHNWDVNTHNLIGGGGNNYLTTIANYRFSTYNNDILLMSGNNGVAVCYDIDRSFRNLDNNFLFLSFTQTTADVKTIERNRGDIYIGAERVYRFPITHLGTYSDVDINEAKITLSPQENTYVNRLISATNSMAVVGNGGLNNYINFLDTFNPTFSVPLDPSFNSRIKSRFLMLDYDAASKVNFFTDEGQYRLPSSVTFSRSSYSLNNAVFFIGPTAGQRNWLHYSRDTEKTFRYYSAMSDSYVIHYSTTFSYRSGNLDPVSIPSNRVGRTQSYFGLSPAQSLAPSVFSNTQSRYIHPNSAVAATWKPATPFAHAAVFPGGLLADETYIMFHEDIGIVMRKFATFTSFSANRTEVGDVIHISSNIIDFTFIVNRLEWFQGAPNNTGVLALYTTRPTTLGGGSCIFEFQYFYHDLDRSITAELTRDDANITYRNLQNYKDTDELMSKFSYHPLSNAYGITVSSSFLEISGKFNEKTAYYNLQGQAGLIVTPAVPPKGMVYKETFLDFGFAPTYNITDYLSKINPQAFTSSKRFNILPTYSVPGNGLAPIGWTKDRAYFNFISTTESNIIKFGENLRNLWESLLPYTFVDIIAQGNSTRFDLAQNLVTNKYELPATFNDGLGGVISGTAYVAEFHKRLPITESIQTFHILSRNLIGTISSDLQLLNNIHRPEVDKRVVTFTFKDSQSTPITKFPTDSYMKVFASDNDIRENISAILYTDIGYNIAMNVINVEKEVIESVNQISPAAINGFSSKMRLKPTNISATQSFRVGDLINVEFSEPDGESRFSGYQTIISIDKDFIFTSKDYNNSPVFTSATISFIKRDPFFNYEPIDLFKAGLDLRVSRSIEVLPENTVMSGGSFSLVNIDLNRYKFEFLDGLSLEEVFTNHHWLLEAEVRNAKVGQNIATNELIWYSGVWKCGRWFGGKWISGQWMSGDWYGGEWNSLPVRNNKVFDDSLTDEQNPRFSKWYGGRWFDGTWNGGSWYGGRRYAGDWNSGLWYNGIWNDGNWNNGKFMGGIWVQGKWKAGIFNCDAKPAFWLFGDFISGDFENGMWYNGFFGNDQISNSRFGTRSSNTRPSIWQSGKWINGEFHSKLNINKQSGTPDVSLDHKFSVWRTGLWNKGDWYGGIAYNIDFRGGVWHGGISEEIQVVGIDKINDPLSTNRIYINGVFNFNPGDVIWIIDDDRGMTFSAIGSNEIPRSYRINQISEHSTKVGKFTGLYLNYKLNTLNIPGDADSNFYTPENGSIGEMGIRVVSRFKDSTWKSGIWTNGIMEGGTFITGIWYNGIFDGKWGQ